MPKRLIFLLITLALVVIEAKENDTTSFENYKKAYSYYLENENNFDAIHELALASYKVGQPAQALALVKKLLIQRPNNPAALLLNAEIYVSQHRYEEAGVKLARILELYPDSDYVKEAYRLVETIRQVQTNFRSNYVYGIKAGFDSNPAQLNTDNQQLMDFAFKDTGISGTTFFEGLPQEADAFSELLAAGNYLHDFGKRGDWFAVYNWNVFSRIYASQHEFDFFQAQAGAGIGYSTRKNGQFLINHSLGLASSNVNNLYHTNGYRYVSYNPSIIYNYKMSETDLFTFGFMHNELSSFDRVKYYNSITGAYDGSEAIFSHGIEKVYFQFDGQLFAKDTYKFQFFHSDYHTNSQNQYYDMNYTYYSHVPYSDYQEYGFDISYNHSINAQINFIVDLYLTTREFKDYYLPHDINFYINPPFDYDFNTDPNAYYREDQYGKLTLTVSYKHSKYYKSALSYAFSENKTNFTPAAYNKHELFYAFYWMP